MYVFESCTENTYVYLTYIYQNMCHTVFDESHLKLQFLNYN